MSGTRATDAQHLATLAAIREHGNVSAAARALGVSRPTMQHRAERARTWQAKAPAEKPRVRVKAMSVSGDVRRAALEGKVGGPPIPSAAVPPEGFVISRNSGAYDANGNLLRQWVGSKRDAGGAFETLPGHAVKGESVLLDADNRVMARWVKTREGATGDGMVAALRQAFAEYDGKAMPCPALPPASDEDTLTVYPIPDLHFGMLGWGKETGDADYDTKIAAKVACGTIAALVQQSQPSAEAVVIILGDWFHANDQKNATPGSGHQLDVDGRWHRVYLEGAKLAISLVDCVAAKHDRVRLVVLPGNHDADAAVTLSVALGLFYSADKRITVDAQPGVNWYHQFGRVLLGATHGHTQRTPEAMAMAMAVDQTVAWGQTRHRHIFSGHLHHERMKEVAGVRVETLSSPAARDAWNAASGYRSGRALSAITFHCDEGEVGRHRVSIRQRGEGL